MDIVLYLRISFKNYGSNDASSKLEGIFMFSNENHALQFLNDISCKLERPSLSAKVSTDPTIRIIPVV